MIKYVMVASMDGSIFVKLKEEQHPQRVFNQQEVQGADVDDNNFSDNHSDAEVIKKRSEVSFAERGSYTRSGLRRAQSTQKQIESQCGVGTQATIP